MIALGDVRVHVLPAGGFALDGGALFGVVPRVIWEKTDPPDERNRVTLGLNVTLIESGGKRVLVDAGLGEKLTDKDRAIYRVDARATLLGSLQQLGLGPGDIDVVINTHLHFDHAGGNTSVVSGRTMPTFPRARYVVQMGEWEDATHPHERNRGTYREEDFVPLAESRQLDPVQGEVEVAPGVRVVPVGGHTAYHQMVVVEGGGQRLVVPTDVLPTSSHLPLPFVTSYDLFPLGTLEAKRRLLRQAVEEGTWIVFYHDPRKPAGKVRREGERFVVSEVSG